MTGVSDKCVGGPPGANISDGLGGIVAQGTKALVLVENISGGRGRGWGKFVGPRRLTLASDEGGAPDLTETMGAPMYVEDIWSGITLVETDHGAVAGDAAAGRQYKPVTDLYWGYWA